MTAQLVKIEVPPIVSASDQDLFASDLGPSTFVSGALSRRGSRSPVSAGPIQARTLSGSCAAAEQSDPELCSFCWILRRRGNKKGSSKPINNVLLFFASTSLLEIII